MLKPIKDNEQYNLALNRVYELMQMDLMEESPEAEEFELLSMLIKTYEDEYFPVPKPHPIEAIKFRMEQMGIGEVELARLLGSRSRKSEILSGKRKLSLSMIRKLSSAFHIPAEVLIQPY